MDLKWKWFVQFWLHVKCIRFCYHIILFFISVLFHFLFILILSGRWSHLVHSNTYYYTHITHTHTLTQIYRTKNLFLSFVFDESKIRVCCIVDMLVDLINKFYDIVIFFSYFELIIFNVNKPFYNTFALFILFEFSNS